MSHAIDTRRRQLLGTGAALGALAASGGALLSVSASAQGKARSTCSSAG